MSGSKGCDKQFSLNASSPELVFGLCLWLFAVVGTCTAGQYGTASTCVACEFATYQPSAGQGKCLSCPNGSNTTTTGASALSGCSGECNRVQWTHSNFGMWSCSNLSCDQNNTRDLLCLVHGQVETAQAAQMS